MSKTLLFKDFDGDMKLATSYSQIEVFLQCPYKWYKSYLLGEREIDTSEALALGTSVHETLEQYANTICEKKHLELAEAIEILDENMEKNNIPFSSQENKVEAYSQHYQMVENLCEKRNNLSNLLFGKTIVGAEIPFRYSVPFPFTFVWRGKEYNEIYLVGSIDLLLIDENGNYIVVDYKSGKKTFDSNKLQNNLQHRIYSLVVQKKYGKIPKQCMYYFTRFDILQQVDKLYEDGEERVIAYYSRGKNKGKIKYKQKSAKEVIEELQDIFVRQYFIADGCKKISDNYRACPSALCSWCTYGLYGNQSCKYRQEYIRKDIPLPERM